MNKTGIGMHVIEEISAQMHISATSFCYWNTEKDLPVENAWVILPSD